MFNFLNDTAIFRAAADLFNNANNYRSRNEEKYENDRYGAAAAATSIDSSQGSVLSSYGESYDGDRTSLSSLSTTRRQLATTTAMLTTTKRAAPIFREIFLGGTNVMDYDSNNFAAAVAPTTSTTIEALFKNLHFVNATLASATTSDDFVQSGSTVGTSLPPHDDIVLPLGLWLSIVVGALLFTLFLFCVVGNLFVISAVLLERDLRSRPQYYLIFSLAIADLLVGMIVTPLGAWATLNQAWHLGVTLCDFWISVDVLVCTSSILHLVAIALDRYWSVTDIYYVQNRTPRRIFGMLLTIWVVSLLISLAPIFGWKDAQFVARVREQHVCLISQQISYQVFSTATAFYIPLCAIIVVYYKIMRAAKKRFRRDRDRRTTAVNQSGANIACEEATAALTPNERYMTHTPLRSGAMTAASDMPHGRRSEGGATPKNVVTIKKKSAPTLLSPRDISPFDNSSATSFGAYAENEQSKVQYESTTVYNNSTSEEEGAASRSSSAAFCCSASRAKNNNNCFDFKNNNHNSNNKNNNNNSCGNGNALNYSTASHLDVCANNNNNNDLSTLSVTTVTLPSQTQLETRFMKKLNVRSLFVKRTSGSNGAKAALVKRKKVRTLKETTESRRERKAWRTLAIITGTFVACWTPFFLVSLYRPICACRISPVVENVTSWLGYLNSALNPVIYTVFSTDFRVAFQRILKRMCLIKGF